MTRRRTLLVLDSCMLVLFATLLSWRLTGLALHEAIGSGLIVLILAHLLVHWSWVESRVLHAVKKSRRQLGSLLLNAGLFAAMGATLVSGVVISKVLIPNTLTPQEYLRWHGMHENATWFTLAFLGLHIALNWDRIVVAIRSRVTLRSAKWGFIPADTVLRHSVWIVFSVGLLCAGVWTIEKLIPGSQNVLMIFPDGHRELRSPPSEITRAFPGANRPSPGQALPRLVVSVVLLAGAATGGRRVVTARRRRTRNYTERMDSAKRAEAAA